MNHPILPRRLRALGLLMSAVAAAHHRLVRRTAGHGRRRRRRCPPPRPGCRPRSRACRPTSRRPGATCAPGSARRSSPQLIQATYGNTYGLTAHLHVGHDAVLGALRRPRHRHVLQRAQRHRARRGRRPADLAARVDKAGNRYANARRLGVMYIIWNDKMWSSYRPSEGWRPYSSCADTPASAYDTACHRNHIHLSLSWEGANGRTSFWTKQVAPSRLGPLPSRRPELVRGPGGPEPRPVPELPRRQGARPERAPCSRRWCRARASSFVRACPAPPSRRCRRSSASPRQPAPSFDHHGPAQGVAERASPAGHRDHLAADVAGHARRQRHAAPSHRPRATSPRVLPRRSGGVGGRRGVGPVDRGPHPTVWPRRGEDGDQPEAHGRADRDAEVDVGVLADPAGRQVGRARRGDRDGPGQAEDAAPQLRAR